MRGAAMSLTAAARGFVVFLLSVSVIQGQKGWGVTYTSTEICAVKGSTVEIHCSYRYPSSYYKIDKTFWFVNMTDDVFVDLKTDPQYSGRVQYDCDEIKNDCTLRITDLRESDSAVYKFRFITNQPDGKYWGKPGVTLSVTDLKVSRSSSSSSSLQCHSSRHLPDHTSYIWYKNGQKIKEGTSPYVDFSYDSADSYSCAVKGCGGFPSPSVFTNQRSSVDMTVSKHTEPASSPWSSVFSTAKLLDNYTHTHTHTHTHTMFFFSCFSPPDAPKLPSVSVSPSAEIVEGSSVTLTCSSDANPAATYTWYKKNGHLHHHLQRQKPQLVFSSIQSSDSGEYDCTAENELGRRTSYYILDVKYGPRHLFTSVSPSAEIVEGDSVTLTCSSDANPAADYTWYKEDHTIFQGPEGNYYFKSISSEDRGIYNCKAENQYGWIMSSSLSVDVQYAPKLPSVSVSPSAEIVEGSSVTLTCSSDANPAANYTWYKENKDSPKASGQIFTITDIRAEHSGNYYCEAQNTRGRHNSTLHLPVVADRSSSGAGKLVAAGTITVVLLAVILLAVFLWIRKKRASRDSSEPGERADNREQRQPEEQGDLQYASIRFSNQADPLYYNMRPAQPLRHTEQREDVEYVTVKFNSARTAPRTRGRGGGADPAALYSTVNKSR
ncbi:Fc receptor-like protein 5 [Epinephelus lanceolatus]